MMDQCRASVVDDGPTLIHHWAAGYPPWPSVVGTLGTKCARPQSTHKSPLLPPPLPTAAISFRWAMEPLDPMVRGQKPERPTFHFLVNPSHAFSGCLFSDHGSSPRGVVIDKYRPSSFPATAIVCIDTVTNVHPLSLRGAAFN